MADDNRQMYEMEYPAPAITSEGSHGESTEPGEPAGPTMVVAMQAMPTRVTALKAPRCT